MKFCCIFMLITVLHCGALSEAASVNNPVFAKQKEGEEIEENLGDNKFFQANKQIFYIYNNNGNNCTKEKPKIQVPDDYIITPGIGAHKLHLTAKTWNQARNVCIKDGAHLAVIQSAEEEAIINKWQAEAEQDQAWLGIHEQFENDDWVTTQDVPLAEVGYINWKAGEPNHVNGTEHCVTYVYNYGAGMNDFNCTSTLPFICKIFLD